MHSRNSLQIGNHDPKEPEPAREDMFLVSSLSHTELEKSRDAVLVVDPASLRILDANEKAAELFGYGRDELLRLSLTDIIVRNQSDGQGTPEVDTFREPGIGFARTAARRKSGAIFSLEMTRCSGASQNGRRASIMIARDSTGQRGVEEAHARLASAVEATADAVVMTDTRGIIVYVNPAFTATTGYQREEIEGRDIHILDSGQHPVTFYESMRERLRREGVWSGRLMHKKKDGTLYEEDCTYSPVKDGEGRIISYVSIRRDVSEKVRLQSIAQAVNTTNNISYVLSGVRHEIANPINAMRSLLHVLKTELDRIDRESLESYVDLFLQEVNRMHDLLGALRTFTPYEKPDLRSIGLSRFMELFEALIRSDMERKGIHLDFFRDSGDLLCVADPRALQQALLNIIANASDALDGRKEPSIKVRTFKKDGMIRIRVEDNGCGISRESRKQLFHPFYTTKAGGTGLGLVIVKKMLGMMNGSIEISSRKDVGTTVELVIPEAGGHAEEGAANV